MTATAFRSFKPSHGGVLAISPAGGFGNTGVTALWAPLSGLPYSYAAATAPSEQLTALEEPWID